MFAKRNIITISSSSQTSYESTGKLGNATSTTHESQEAVTEYELTGK